MSNIKKVQIGETVYDLDAKSVDGHQIEETGVASNTTTIPTTAQVKAYVDANAGGGGVTYIDEVITQTQWDEMSNDQTLIYFSQTFQNLLKTYGSDLSNYRIIITENSEPYNTKYEFVYNHIGEWRDEDSDIGEVYEYQDTYYFKLLSNKISDYYSSNNSNSDNGKSTVTLNDFAYLYITVYFNGDQSYNLIDTLYIYSSPSFIYGFNVALYNHHISLYQSNNSGFTIGTSSSVKLARFSFEILLYTKETNMSLTYIANYLYSNGYTSIGTAKPCSGFYRYTSGDTTYNITGVYADSSSKIGFIGINNLYGSVSANNWLKDSIVINKITKTY